MYRSIPITAAAIAAAIAGGLAASPACADSVADFYSGKTVTILIGYSMGGTYGQYATIMSHYLDKFVPGHPSFIVQSMPGAGGMKASNYAYNVVPKNGTVLLEPPDSIVISQILTPNAAKYDARKFTWIGNMIESIGVVCVRADSKVNTFKDAKKIQIPLASTGTGSQTFLVPSTLNGVFHTKFKIIMGYKGSAGSLHAMEQNEVQGVSLTWLAFKTVKPEWFRGNHKNWKAIPIVQLGFKKDKELSFAPLARDLTKNEDDRKILDFIATLAPIGRGLTAPPGMPKDRIAAFRKAFEAMVDDAAVKADVEKRNLRLNPTSGAEVQKIVADVLTMSPELRKRAQTMILGKAAK